MQSDEQEIRQLVATWMAATKAGDIERVLSLMAEDVVFLVPGQPPMIGRSAFAASAQAQPSQGPVQFDGTSEIQEIKVLGEWAFMWTKLTVVVTRAGGAPPMTRAGHTLSILKKQNGKWVLARDANMLTVVSKGSERRMPFGIANGKSQIPKYGICNLRSEIPSASEESLLQVCPSFTF